MRPKTPRIKPIKNRFCDKILNTEKEVTLLEVAEKLEKIVFNLNNKSDIDLTSKKLKDILLDIYIIINQKHSNKIEKEIKIDINNLKINAKEVEDKKDIKEKREDSKDISKDNININHDLNNNTNKVVNLNKEELISTHKFEPYNFSNSCNNLVYIQKFLLCRHLYQ